MKQRLGAALLTVVLALSALATVATLFIPKITEWVLDDAVPNKDVAMIGRMAAIFVGDLCEISVSSTRIEPV